MYAGHSTTPCMSDYCPFSFQSKVFKNPLPDQYYFYLPRIVVPGLCEYIGPLVYAELSILVRVCVLERVLEVDQLLPLAGLFRLQCKEPSAHLGSWIT